jgi:hypothetical protein
MASRDAIYSNVDPRLNASTSTHASDATLSTLTTLVEPSTPRKDKKHLEGTGLSLQPCPSLASANRILSLSDLPPNHDAPMPIDENTYRRYEHEGKLDSPFNDSDICADYDYIHAIDVLIYHVCTHCRMYPWMSLVVLLDLVQNEIIRSAVEVRIKYPL